MAALTSLRADQLAIDPGYNCRENTAELNSANAEFIASIKARNGDMSHVAPIRVYRIKGTAGGRPLYMVYEGHRRLATALACSTKEQPVSLTAIVTPKPTDVELVDALVLSNAGQNLTAVGKTEVVKRYLALTRPDGKRFGNGDIAKRLGVTGAAVSQMRKVVEGPVEFWNATKAGKMSVDKATKLARWHAAETKNRPPSAPVTQGEVAAKVAQAEADQADRKAAAAAKRSEAKAAPTTKTQVPSKGAAPGSAVVAMTAGIKVDRVSAAAILLDEAIGRLELARDEPAAARGHVMSAQETVNKLVKVLTS